MQIEGFDAETAAELDATLPGLLDQYGSTIAFIARPILGDVDGEVIVSRMTPVDMQLAVDDRSATIQFEQPVGGVEDLVDRAVALAEVARGRYPDAPLTELEQIMSSVRSQRLYQGVVVGSEQLSASVYSVRIGPFPSFSSLGWDQSVSVFTGSDGREVPSDLTFERWREMPAEEAPRARTYTIRGIDDHDVVELWVALHGDDPLSVSSWAQRCAVGDPVSILGPRGRFEHRSDVARAVLIADETALGAAAAMVDHLGVPAEIVGLVCGSSDEVAFGGGSEVTWLHVGPDSDERTAAVLERLRIDDSTLYWGAGEFSMIGALRRALRRGHGIPASRVALTAYWSADL